MSNVRDIETVNATGAAAQRTAPAKPDAVELIVGLGNPGRRYEHTRHNIGFMVVDQLVEKLPATRWRSEHQALVSKASYLERSLLLAKPQTFMNLSGQAVRALLSWYRLLPANMLVISDDLDLPFGRLRLRPGGSPGGHNGLRSIVADLGTQQFPRLRIGIGRPEEGETIDWVLSSFDRSEQTDLPAICDAAVEAVLMVVRDGLHSAMNAVNGQADVRSPRQEPRRAGSGLETITEQAGEESRHG